MSETVEITIDEEYTAYFAVEYNNAAVTGLVVGDFTIALYYNGVLSGLSLTFTDEVENGMYSIKFTPNALGDYVLFVKNATYFSPTGKKGQYICTQVKTDVTEMQTKLPTNNIMGSSVKTDKDDEIDAILVDTDEIQNKLPTNEIMGSSTKSDKDDEIDAILLDTGTTLPSQITSEHDTTDALITSSHNTTDTNVNNNHITTDALITSSHATTDALIASVHVTTDSLLVTLQGDVTAIKTKTDNMPADLATELKIIQGIIGNDFYIDQIVRDANNNITSYRLRVYSDSGSVGTTSNVILTLTVTGTFSAVTGYLTVLQGVGA